MAEKRKLRKTSAWQRLKKRWNRKGIVEIDVDHPSYSELCCIRQGIREVLLNYPQLGPQVSTSAPPKPLYCDGQTRNSWG